MRPRHVYPPSVLVEIFEESREPKILPINVKTQARSYESRRLQSGCTLITLKKTNYHPSSRVSDIEQIKRKSMPKVANYFLLFAWTWRPQNS